MHNRPRMISIPEPNFPYLVAEENKHFSSYFVISLPDNYDYGYQQDEETLFYIAAGELHSSNHNNQNSLTTLSLRHSTITDDEDSAAYIAQFALQNLQMLSASIHSITYTGWLVEAKFYPQGHENTLGDDFDPFLNYQKDAEEEFPYLPPTVIFQQQKFSTKQELFPKQIELTLHYNVENAEEKLYSYMAQHAENRAIKKQKEKEIKEKRVQEKIQKNKQHAEWLLTDEGRSYTAARKTTTKMKELVNIQGNSDEDMNVAKKSMETFLDTLTVEEKKFVNEELQGQEKNYSNQNFIELIKFVTQYCE